MPEIRTLTVKAYEVKKNDTFWFTGDVVAAGVKAVDVSIVVDSIRVASKYVWINETIRVPKDLEVHVGRSFKTEAEVKAETDARLVRHFEDFVAEWREAGRKASVKALSNMVSNGITWSEMADALNSDAMETTVKRFVDAWDFTQQEHPEKTILEFCAEYAQYLTKQIVTRYSFDPMSKSTSTMSNIISECELSAKIRLAAFLSMESMWL